MTITPKEVQLNHQAFKGLSEEGRKRLAASLESVHYGVGQNLCRSNVIPSRVLLVLSGKARLLGHTNGKLCTLAMLRPGAIVGLASLLRVEGCEEVIASTELQGLAIPDAVILELYTKEEAFRHWCNTKLFPAELIPIVEILLKRSEQASTELPEAFREAIKAARLEKTGDNNQGTESSREYFTASANTDLKIGTALNNNLKVRESKGPFPSRIISLPTRFIEDLTEAKERGESQDDFKHISSSDLQNQSSQAGINVEPTGLTLGQDRLRDRISLIQTSGELEETLACFAMLAQAMKLPYRRDAIEKTVRDALRRGKKPSLPMLGQLAAGMGLHVVGAKVESRYCTNLNVPCLMPWSGSFAVVVESNADGLVVAHPRLGWLEISPAEIAETCSEGIDLILVDRTATTQEQKFDFTWFWPALRRYRTTLLQVLVASFVVQLFTLANPLLIQVIIDKVISQRSLDTLQVLGIGLIGVTLFEGVLGSLRTFLFADTTNRIDMRLGAE